MSVLGVRCFSAAADKCFAYLAGILITVWWLYDLQYHWRNLADYHYGWLVLILSGYLIWERWPVRPRTRNDCSVGWSVVLAITGVPFVLAAELYKQAMGETPAASFCLSIGCVLFLLANGICFLGRAATRHFCFPLLFFCMAVPLPGILWSPIVLALKSGVIWMNVEVMGLLGVPAVQEGNVIRLANCVVGVDDACSGIRSLQSSVMAGLFIGGLLYERWPIRVFFVLGGVGLALVGNLARAAALTVTAHYEGLEALERVHDSAGWSVFLFTSTGLALFAWIASRLSVFCAREEGIARENF